MPGDGYMKKGELDDESELKPQNDYTVPQKVEMALSMAESLADLHGFQDGVM